MSPCFPIPIGFLLRTAYCDIITLMIASFRPKGLRKYFESGKPSKPLTRVDNGKPESSRPQVKVLL